MATTIAAADGRMPRGLVLPHLGSLADGMRMTVRRDQEARLALAMLDAGVATEAAYRDGMKPEAFIQQAFADWCEAHGSSWIDRRLQLFVAFAHQVLARAAATHAEELSDYTVVSLRPSTATPVVTGNLFEWARGVDPRFAPTIDQAIRSLDEYRLLRVWDQHAARIWIGDRYGHEELEPAARLALRPVPWLTEVKAFSVGELEAARTRWTDPGARRIASAILWLYRALEPTRDIRRFWPTEDELLRMTGSYDMEVMDPLPGVRVSRNDADVIEAAYDMAFGQLEGILMPSVLFKIESDTAAAVTHVFDDLAAVFRAFRAYVHLLDALPGQARFCLGGLQTIEDELRGLPADERDAFGPLALEIDREAARFRVSAARRQVYDYGAFDNDESVSLQGLPVPSRIPA